MRGVGVLLSWLLCASAVAGSLDQPFTATPAELRAEAARAPASQAEITFLRDDSTIDFDDAGRASNRLHQIYIVQNAGDQWSEGVTAPWLASIQDAPVVRARVLVGDQFSDLDLAQIKDTGAPSEVRYRFAPLPLHPIGAIVETEITTIDREALPAGRELDLWIGRSVPGLHETDVISAPVARKLRVRAHAIKTLAMHSVAHGRETWRFELGAPPPHADRVVGAPPELMLLPGIAMSTAPSWQAVGRAYQKIIDGRIASGPITPPAGKLADIVAWFRTKATYDGRDLDATPLTPATPADTLARGEGSDADLAVLLVAALRAAGIPADVVLLLGGPGEDLDPELPGFGPFDHAIVRARVDRNDVWIDPTELPNGQLAMRDQGRRYLATGATSLGTTPASVSTDNPIRQVITYRAAELDAGTVTDSEQRGGMFAGDNVAYMRDTPAAERLESYRDYARRIYDAELVGVTGTDVITAETAASQRVSTTRKAVGVYLTRRAAFFDLSPDFWKEGPRTLDYVFPAAHTVDIVHRIELPIGFVAPALVRHEQRAIGTMTLTIERAATPGLITVTYHLDTGKRRITAAELAATRTAANAFREEESEHLVCPLLAAQLMAGHEPFEAIAEVQRLIALHPKEAAHYDQLADVYQQLGLGDAARRMARRATEIEPTRADAWTSLAFYLHLDAFGRERPGGGDRRGSIAAFRKALAINATYQNALLGLAVELARDDDGHLSENPADLREAVAIWRRVDGDDHTEQIIQALLLGGDVAEARSEIDKLPASDAQTELLIVQTALARGAPAALELAGTRGVSGKPLERAGLRLMIYRRYDLVRALVTASGTADGKTLEQTSRLAQIDFARLDPADPRTVVTQTLASMFGAHVTPAVGDPKLLAALDHELDDLRDKLEPWKFLPGHVGLDLIASAPKLTVEGDAVNGWRVVFEIGGDKASFYAVRAGGRATLIGANDHTVQLGVHVLDQLGRNQLDDARRWLGWFADDKHHDSALSAVAMFYRQQTKPSRETLELFAAFLMQGESPRATPILRRCAVPSVQMLCSAYLIATLEQQGDWRALVDAAAAVPEGSKVWKPLQVERATALYELGDRTAANAVIDAALAKFPDDPALVRERVEIAVDGGPWAVARPLVEKFVSTATADPVDLNNAAWWHLYYDTDPTVAHAYGERAVAAAGKFRAPTAHTNAAIEATSGHPDAATELLGQVLATHRDGIAEPGDWYVQGRIAESLGLRDDAIAAYRLVVAAPKPAHVMFGPQSRQFAERGLARLSAAARPSPAPRAGTPPRTPTGAGP